MSTVEVTFGPLLLVLFCLGVTLWERQRCGTALAPFGTLAWPYAAIVVLINFGGRHFGFFPVSLKSILFVLACLMFFILGNGAAGVLSEDRRLPGRAFFNRRDARGCFSAYRNLFVCLAVVTTVFGFIHFFRSINQVGWLGIASSEFKESFGKGPLAHVVVLGRPAFLFLFASYCVNRKLSHLILLGFMFALVLLLQIKNNILVLLLAGLYFSLFYRLIRVNWKKILVVLAVIYCLFNVSYIIGFSRIGVGASYSNKIQLYLLNHFFAYLFGGPIGFSEILQDPTYPLYTIQEVFAVPVNLYRNFVTNDVLVDLIFHHWIPISSIYQYFHTSNVFTLFGMLYMYIGSMGAWMVMFFLGAGAGLVRFAALRRPGALGWQMVYALFLGYLTISFFGLYFNIIIVYETAVYMLAVPMIYNGIRSGCHRVRRSLVRSEGVTDHV